MTQSNSKKKNQRKGVMDLPFTGKVSMYNYRYGKCAYEQEVPDFVVDAFAAVDGLEADNMPILQCDNYGGELKYVD